MPIKIGYCIIVIVFNYESIWIFNGYWRTTGNEWTKKLSHILLHTDLTIEHKNKFFCNKVCQ